MDTLVHFPACALLGNYEVSKLGNSCKLSLFELCGGALALAGGSVIYIFEPAILHFVENIADSFGGAIYTCYESDQDLPYCFHGIENAFKMNISFSGNSAVAGSAIFGQEIDKTLSNVIFSRYRESYTATVADLLFYLLNVKIDDNNGSKISSLPNRICRCINGQPDCSDPPSPYEVSVFPGQTVGVSLVAVDQRNGSVLPAPISAQYVPDEGASFAKLQTTQESTSTCSDLHYTILSSHTDSQSIIFYCTLSINIIIIPFFQSLF